MIYLYISTIFFILFLPIFCSVNFKIENNEKLARFYISVFKIKIIKGYFELKKEGIYQTVNYKTKKVSLKNTGLKENFKILPEVFFYKILIKGVIKKNIDFPLLYLMFSSIIMSDIMYYFLRKKGIKLDTDINLYENEDLFFNLSFKTLFIVNNITIIKLLLNGLIGKIKNEREQNKRINWYGNKKFK